jgi:tRNA-Thr(GGU) m(6)t(6)A37 methyltransferase TsaA
MKQAVEMNFIGRVNSEKGFSINVDKEYWAGLTGLEEFSHVKVLWVFNQINWDGKTLVVDSPYKKLTHEIGLFATRSPFRPNPIAVTNARILSVDMKKGIIEIDWIDAEEGSPVIDIKPYHPSEDIVSDVKMPQWCAHWPMSREESGEFDWESEFNFE